METNTVNQFVFTSFELLPCAQVLDQTFTWNVINFHFILLSDSSNPYFNMKGILVIVLAAKRFKFLICDDISKALISTGE